MTTVAAVIRQSVLIKIGFIGFLVLLLLLPMSMIESLIADRQVQGAVAATGIKDAWGHEQTVGGPFLVLPYRQPVRGAKGETTWQASRLFLLPESIQVSGTLAPQHRYRGIHRVPVYTAALSLHARFGAPRPGSLLSPGAEVDWDGAVMALLVSDARAIKSAVRLAGDLGSVPFEPGGEAIPGLPPVLVARLAARAQRSEGFDVRLGLELAGSVRLSVLPMGDETRVALSAPWPSPSFEGGWLPAQRQVTHEGFTASWRVLDLGRGFPSRWRAGEVAGESIQATAFGVRLFEPVSVYQQATRAAKYAVLFVGLSFIAWFMIEIHARRLLHPLQYLLMGFANCMFYLLLVSLSEHVAFPVAYLLACAASVSLVAGYSASVLASRRLGLAVAALLAATYGFLYVVLQAEDFAMLIGALGLFAVLAAVMYLTRHVDWYDLSLSPRTALEPGAG